MNACDADGPYASFSPSSTCATYSTSQQHVLDQLRLFLGEEAPAVYERCGRSLLQLTNLVRESSTDESAPWGHRLLAAGLDLAQALLLEPMRTRPVFESPAAVKSFLTLHFAGQPFESFVVMYLDAQHHLLAVRELFQGTLAQTSVYPREVLREALRYGAGAVVLAHNHPSGSSSPSKADEVLTQTLKAALAFVDVRVIDHIIVAGTSSSSFAELGLL